MDRMEKIVSYTSIFQESEYKHSLSFPFFYPDHPAILLFLFSRIVIKVLGNKMGRVFFNLDKKSDMA